jgi:DNA invertase Pin-like site-specific DNA recombinase
VLLYENKKNFFLKKNNHRGKFMKIGYARVSTKEQDNAAQIEALTADGCERIFTEQASGGRWDRPELQTMLGQLRKGDVVTVWKLDRFSRSLQDVLVMMQKIEDRQAGFKSLTEQIDTTSAAGRMIMHIVGAFAEFERSIIRERTLEGLRIANNKGRYGGPPFKLTKPQQEEVIRTVTSGEITAAQAARIYQVDPATISRLLARHKLTKSQQEVSA